jgi:hypothetical protein
MRSIGTAAVLIAMILTSACEDGPPTTERTTAPARPADPSFAELLSSEPLSSERSAYDHRLEYREALRKEIELMSEAIHELERVDEQPTQRGRIAHATLPDLYRKREHLIRELERLPYISQTEWAEYYGGIEAARLDLRRSLLDAYDKLVRGA